MNSPTSMGMNRSGIDMAPQGAEQMVQAVGEFPPTSPGGEQTLMEYRSSYLMEADPIGTVPVPGTLKGVAKAGMQKLRSEEHTSELQSRQYLVCRLLLEKKTNPSFAVSSFYLLRPLSALSLFSVLVPFCSVVLCFSIAPFFSSFPLLPLLPSVSVIPLSP